MKGAAEGEAASNMRDSLFVLNVDGVEARVENKAP
jgi:hypothetical protein